jgi:hypothetical protein
LLSGEPGIGKSRMTAALLERVAAEPHTRLRYFCSPQHTDSAFYPIISQMERAAGFAHDDTAQAKLDKLDAVLARCVRAGASGEPEERQGPWRPARLETNSNERQIECHEWCQDVRTGSVRLEAAAPASRCH